MSGGSNKAPEIKETDAERALAEVSANKWQDYQENFVPLENEYMQSVNDLNTESTKGRVEAKAQSNVTTQNSGLLSQATQKNFANGLDPTSGAARTSGLALSQSLQNSKTSAGNQGRFGAENAYLQGVGNVVAMGNEQDATAFESMGSIADRASGMAITEANNDYKKWQGDQEMTGAAIGGLTAYGLDSFKPAKKKIGVE